MNKTSMILIVTALLAAPLALAHDPTHPLATPDGTKKLYCEATSEWSVHDYGPVANGVTLGQPENGNTEDCVQDPWDLVVVPGRTCPPGYTVVLRLFARTVCGRLPFADFDGHKEFATGGAWLLACDAACGSSGTGAGAQACWGEMAHHGWSVTVWDIGIGAGASFTIGVDDVDVTGLNDPCGDRLVDVSMECIGSCTPFFPPGLDGAYQVFVQGTQGHVIS